MSDTLQESNELIALSFLDGALEQAEIKWREKNNESMPESIRTVIRANLEKYIFDYFQNYSKESESKNNLVDYIDSQVTILSAYYNSKSAKN